MEIWQCINRVSGLKTNFYVLHFFALILERRGVIQSRVAHLPLADLSLVPNDFTYSCDTRVKCLG